MNKNDELNTVKLMMEGGIAMAESVAHTINEHPDVTIDTIKESLDSIIKEYKQKVKTMEELDEFFN